MWFVVRKKTNTEPRLNYDMSKTLPAAPLNVRLLYKNTPNLSAFGYQL